MKNFKRFCYICIAAFVVIIWSGGCHFIHENKETKNYARKTDSVKQGKHFKGYNP